MENKKNTAKRMIDSLEKSLRIMESTKDVYPDFYRDVEKKINRIKLINKIQNKWNLDIPEYMIHNENYIDYNDNIKLINFREGDGRSLTNSDSGKQPHNEYLLNITFPNGPYALGKDYPVDVFRDLMNELMEYEPKYTDKINNSLYYSLEPYNQKTTDVFNKLGELLDIYRKLSERSQVDVKISKLQEEIDKLEKLKQDIKF